MPGETDVGRLERHALIIEDEFLVGMDVQAVLKELGFTSFAFASTASQAIEQGCLRRPDLVTADVNLLDGDGVSVIRALREAHGPVAVVFVTGDTAAVDQVADCTVVAKPFVPAALSEACLRTLAAAEAAA